MGAFYTKYRRVFFGLIIANALISMLQLAFAWSHLFKHEWWGLGLSVFFAVFNGWCAVAQYKNWRRVQREEKEYMWRTLSAPSEALR
jgi:hypothetical protein